jgi:hypothetical protein
MRISGSTGRSREISDLTKSGDSNKLVADFDRCKRGQAFQPGHGMVNRFMTVQSIVATRCLGVPAIVTLAAMAALAALTADAAASEARPAPTTEATAPREAGEPIMAIVSIGSQQVTFYDDAKLITATLAALDRVA